MTPHGQSPDRSTHSAEALVSHSRGTKYHQRTPCEPKGLRLVALECYFCNSHFAMVTLKNVSRIGQDYA
ncbi:Ankyrin repeat and SOCS box protein 3 [Fusarium oxysporum f. sp. albedinis]|nr:Ankyrin repeat and SOCS box protein 3 [Fusarium oxysporum f. sp. albedinis]